MNKKNMIIVVLATFCLCATVFIALPTLSVTTSEYDPWADVSGPTQGVPDGTINMRDINYEILHFNTYGTPIDRSSLMSIEFDSGWINIKDRCGQYFGIPHNLNSTDVMVDIQGKTTLDGGVHQRNLGGAGYTPGWNTAYGGADQDYAESMVQTADGGYALAGWTTSFGDIYGDAWLIKTDANGLMQWNRTYGGVNNDEIFDLVQAVDGGYALAGITNSFGGGGLDFWLIKTDADGIMQWNKTYGGTNNDLAFAIVRTADGGYMLAGETESLGAGMSDSWLIKTDVNGTMQWGRTYGGTGDDCSYSLVESVGDGYVLAGYTDSFGAGGSDFWLVKTDASGNPQWNMTYGGASGDAANSVVQTVEGGYALTGLTYSLGAGVSDAWLIKTDGNGIMQWSRTYGGYDGDTARSVVQTVDGGYACAGYTASFSVGGNIDGWLVKTDADGIMQWQRTYGTANYSYVNSVVQTAGNGYTLAGYTGDATTYDGWLIKTETDSGLMWTDSTANTITLYRGATDPYWNFVRVRIWKPATP